MDRVHEVAQRERDRLVKLVAVGLGLGHPVEAAVLAHVRACEEQVGELLALRRVTAGDAAQLRQQLAEVLVDEGAALVLAVADADDLLPLGVRLECLRVRRLLEDGCRLDVRHDLLSRRLLRRLELRHAHAQRLHLGREARVGRVGCGELPLELCDALSAPLRLELHLAQPHACVDAGGGGGAPARGRWTCSCGRALGQPYHRACHRSRLVRPAPP